VKNHAIKIFTAALMISGNTIGAGVLGLPVLGGMAGAIPSIIGLMVIWMVMLGTAFILAWRMTSHGPEIKGLPSLFQKELGTLGKGFATVGYLINYFGILVAYLCGGATIITHLFNINVPESIVILVLFAILTGITLLGVEVVRKSNAAFMALLFAAFFYLIIDSGKNAHLQWLQYADWRFFPAVFPVFICAFTYHNTIPIVVRVLDYDRPSVNKALIAGTAIPLILSILWTLSVIGSLPLDGSGENTLSRAFQENLPATIPLAHILNSKVFTAVSLIFSLLAIATSYMAVGTGLLNFMKDLTQPLFKKRNRLSDAIFAFGLPLFITLCYPDLFLIALNVAGGVGIGMVFGILPSMILIKMRKTFRPGLALGFGLMLFFAVTMGLELLQETGRLKIKPNLEHWTSTFQQE
jgi:tyrosine-specific transport protein